jgi:MFS family permease
MGVILIPVLIYMLKWLYEGYETGESIDRERRGKVNPFITCLVLLLGIFGGSLGFALMATFLIAWTGWIPGLLIFAVAAFFLGYRLFFPFICRWLMLVKEPS